MITAIQTTGRVALGEFDVYLSLWQPYDHYAVTTVVPISVNYNRGVLTSSFNPHPVRAEPPEKVLQYGTLESYATETTRIYLYVLYDGLGSGSHDAYYGSLIVTNAPNTTAQEYISVGASFYRLTLIFYYPSKLYYFQRGGESTERSLPTPPTYIDLLSGYYLDARAIPESPTIIPSKSEVVEIGYYRENKLESVTGLRSIDWMTYQCSLTKGKPYKLPIYDCVLGTLYCSSSGDVESKIKSLPTALGKYDYADYFDSRLSGLFSQWQSLYNAALATPLAPPAHIFTSEIVTKYVQQTESLTRVLRTLGANNNHWDNRPNSTPDFNFDINHPMFKIDDARTYDWHFKPQSDQYDLGDLIMDSTRTIEIHSALNASKFCRNELDDEKPRVANLGNYIERIAQINGYRIDANGDININEEKKKTRRLISEKQSIDQKQYSGNSFGSEGMLVRRLPNYFDRKDIKSGGVVAIHDQSQLMLEILDQINLAFGLQDSGAIEIKHGDNTHRYPNLLALVTEIAIHQFNQSDYAKQTHISSIVTQEQTKEIIGGLGLPTVSKNIVRTVNGKKAGIPYWGIAPHASLAKRIDTCTYNVGIVLGQLL